MTTVATPLRHRWTDAPPAPRDRGPAGGTVRPRPAPTAPARAQGGPPTRDRFVDVVRALATVAIVTVHWLMPEASWDGRHVHAGNALSHGAAWTVTWVLQLLGVLFFAAGAAAAYQSRRRRALTPDGQAARTSGAGSGTHPHDAAWWRVPVRSLRRIAGPVFAFAAAWVVAAVVLPRLGVPDGAVGFAVHLAPQLLWFLGVWLVLLALTAVLHRAWVRLGWKAVAVAATLPVAVDLLRFGGLARLTGVDALAVPGAA